MISNEIVKSYKEFVADTEKYDEDVPLNELQISEDNDELYDKYDEDDFADLITDIKTNGILEPVEVEENTRNIIGGNTRTLACLEIQKELNFIDKVPVKYLNKRKAKNATERKMRLARKNMGRRGHISQQWHSINDMINTYEKDYKTEPENEIIQEFCRILNVPYKRYTMLRKLENGYQTKDKNGKIITMRPRPDLLEKVLDKDDKLSIGVAIKQQKEDDGNIVTQSKSKLLNKVLKKEDVVYAVGVMSDIITRIKSLEAYKPKSNSSWNPADNIQPNTTGGLIHELMTNALAVSINENDDDDLKIEAFAGKNNKEDLLIRRINGSIEHKSSVVINNKPKGWVTNPRMIKDGYYKLTGYNTDYDRVFSAYGYIKHDCWKKGGTMAMLDLEKLYKLWKVDNEFHKIFFGDLKYENDKYVVYLDEVIDSE